MQRRYWAFYWPLSLTGLAVLLARQFQNGALTRFPDAVRELVIFAYASSIFWLFNASMIFIPQMANVFARSERAKRICLRFTILISVVLTIPLAVGLFLTFVGLK